MEKAKKMNWQIIKIYDCHFRPKPEDVPIYTHTRVEDEKLAMDEIEDRVEDAASIISGIDSIPKGSIHCFRIFGKKITIFLD